MVQPQGNNCERTDLRTAVKALLEGSQPREPVGPARRRPNPLYSSGSGNKRRSDSQPNSARGKSKSQPASPTGISKTRAIPRGAAGAGGRSRITGRRLPLGSAASAGASPVKDPPQQQHKWPTTLRLDFGNLTQAAPRLDLSPSKPTQQRLPPPPPQQPLAAATCGPSASQHLLGFGRLHITSPNPTPETSPRPEQPAIVLAAGGQITAPVAPFPRTQACSERGPSLWRHQQQQSLGSGDENCHCIPPSPLPPEKVCCNQESAVAADQTLPLTASSNLCNLSWQGSQQLSPEQAAAAPTAGAPLPSPFNSSQERRLEIALLFEMASDVAAAWSSQEDEAPGEIQQQQPLWPEQLQQPVPSVQQPFRELWAAMLKAHHVPPLQQQAAPASSRPRLDAVQAQLDAVVGAANHGPAATVALQGSAKNIGSFQAATQMGSQQGEPNICGFTSQEISEAADPWSQHSDDRGEQQRQQQQRGSEQPARAGMGQPVMPAVLATAVPAAGCLPPPVVLPALRQYLPQQLSGEPQGRLNQWAALGPVPRLQEREVSRAAPQSPHARNRRQQERQQHEEEENRMVGSTCPVPQLLGVRESFATQREAFAAADQHNQHMPLAPQPLVAISQVPLEELLPPSGAGAAAGAANSRGGAVQSSSSASGGSGSVLCAGGRRLGGAQHADPASHGQHQQSMPAAGPVDFLTRFQAGARHTVDSSGYTAPPLKRQQEEPEGGEEQQQQRLKQVAINRRAKEQYEAALQALQTALMQQQEDQEGEAQQAVSASTSSSICSLQPLEAAASTAAAVKSVAAGAEAEERRQEAVRTFCVERRARGGTYYRTFTAASYPAVWQLFRHTAPKDLHWYEVIREGRPAHLYFDLEFVPRLNPQVDGEALVDVLLQHVAAQLRRHFDLILDPRFVYELDSSTPNKFSRHLTLRLPGHAFSNNHAMGKFVAQVLAASDSKLLVVRKEQEPGGGGGGPQLGSMVDMAVYSKNRHWRMSRCCKGGKEAVLHPTGRYATAPGAGVSDATVFLDTLVCNVEPHARLLQMPDPLPTAGPNNRGGVGMLGAAALQSGIGGLGSCGLQVTWKQGAIDTALLPDQVAELRRLAEEAVSFIEKVATQRAGAPARARTLAFCGGGAKVAYSMIGPGSHYCENIGRPHTSNHVFFVADFLGGTYTQKCHDPDCAHFRSAWMPLTAELCRLATGAAALPPPSPSASGRSAGTRG